MKFKAYTIKAWIMGEISPMGWASLITRAMPELMEHNHRFSAYYISERTSWSEMEVDIINWHLRKMYKMELPSDLLTSSVYLSLSYLDALGVSFFETSRKWQKSVSKVFNYFR